MKETFLCLGVCLFAAVASGAEVISQFAKSNLDIDLNTCPFGKDLQTTPEFVKPSGRPFVTEDNTGAFLSDMNFDKEMFWFSNGTADSYGKKYPDRILSYGFKNQRLVAIHIFINAMGPSEAAKQKQVALNKIRDEIRVLSGKNGLKFEDGRYRIEYCGYCNTGENSFAGIQIKLLDKAQ